MVHKAAKCNLTTNLDINTGTLTSLDHINKKGMQIITCEDDK